MGEPVKDDLSVAVGGVYPHRCGGTRTQSAHRQHACGLSPQVWGNLESDFVSFDCFGSIPTGVGEPRRQLEIVGSCNRSIPTGVGEPGLHDSAHATNQICGLSPQVWGNLESDFVNHRLRQGLSPQVWGNPRQFQSTMMSGVNRSIPTGVGEPGLQTRCMLRSTIVRVYPHRCGGTNEVLTGVRITACQSGLSPQVWGNQLANRRVFALCVRTVYPHRCGGTTPAKRIKCFHPSCHLVYPHRCGGTLCMGQPIRV